MRLKQVMGPVGVMLALTPFVILLTECGSDPVLGPQQTPEPQVALLLVSDLPTYDFGTSNINVAIDKTFTVTNSGVVPATALSGDFATSTAFSYKGGTFPGTGGSCGASLSVGSTCAIVVTFKPTYVSEFASLVTIGYNDGDSNRATKPSSESPNLKGKGQ